MDLPPCFLFLQRAMRRSDGLRVRGRKELLDGQPCFCNQTAQRASCNFRVIGYRERSDVAWPSHDDMTAFLADHLPTKTLKDLDDL